MLTEGQWLNVLNGWAADIRCLAVWIEEAYDVDESTRDALLQLERLAVRVELGMHDEAVSVARELAHPVTRLALVDYCGLGFMKWLEKDGPIEMDLEHDWYNSRCTHDLIRVSVPRNWLEDTQYAEASTQRGTRAS